jgi:hypothetical protein
VNIDVEGSGGLVDGFVEPVVNVEDGNNLLESGFLFTVATGRGGKFIVPSLFVLLLLLFV